MEETTLFDEPALALLCFIAGIVAYYFFNRWVFGINKIVKYTQIQAKEAEYSSQLLEIIAQKKDVDFKDIENLKKKISKKWDSE